jgi:4-hydroxybenzoate polyprenyltransferase
MKYVRLARAEQWSKNLFLLAGLVFGQKLGDTTSVILTLIGVLLFSLVASAVYVINDVRDRAEDQLHPTKCKRPVASGAISPSAAIVFACALLAAGLGGAFVLDPAFCFVTLVYFTLQVFYTFGLKQLVVLDVILIGIGFVLRAVAGAVIVHVEISHWLVLCTFNLCLFMGFSKRRCELHALQNGQAGHAGKHRRTLVSYSPELLNHMTTLSAGIAVVTFILYANDSRTQDVFGTNYLVYTLPIVVYAIFRFTLLVEQGRVHGPTDVLLRDRPFQAALLLWGVAALVIVYRGRALAGFFQKLAEQSAN